MNEEFSKIYQLLLTELQSWFELAVKMLPNLAVAVVIMIIFFFAARAIRTLSYSVFSRISDNKAVTKLLATLSYLLVLYTGSFVVLGILNLDKTVTSLLAGAGVIGLV